MKFIFLIQALRSGGAEKQVLLISRCLAEVGHDCSIYSLSAVTITERIENLKRSALNAGVSMILGNGSRLGAAVQSLRFARAIRAAADPIIWAWGLRADLIAKAVAGLNHRARLLCSLRDASRDRVRAFARFERFRHQRVHLYISNSWFSSELLASVVPGVLPRTRVIWNALDGDELDQPAVQLPAAPAHLRVAMLGNLKIQKKGYDLVVQLAESIQRLALPVTIYIAGRDDARGWLQQEIATRGLAQQLVYEGEAGAPLAYLRRHHAFLLMSRYEGMPNALLEAMNLGLPCIASKVGDVPRFARDRHDIRCVEIGDVEGALQVLKGFVQDWPAALQLANNGRSFCQKQLSLSRLKRDLAALCDELLPSRLSRIGCHVTSD